MPIGSITPNGVFICVVSALCGSDPATTGTPDECIGLYALVEIPQCQR
jgi:hypothetical protein